LEGKKRSPRWPREDACKITDRKKTTVKKCSVVKKGGAGGRDGQLYHPRIELGELHRVDGTE